MTWIFMLLGLVAGVMMGGVSESILGMLVGIAIGQTFAIRNLQIQNTALSDALKTFEIRFENGTGAVVERLRALEGNASTVTETVDTVQEAVDTAQEAVDTVQEAADTAQEAVAYENAIPSVAELAVDLNTAKPAQPAAETPAIPPRARAPEPVRPPSAIAKAFAAAKSWLLGGNVVLRVGVLLLFLGLAFLLRYATKDLVVPVEFRYVGVALGSLAMIALGWMLRRRNENYALIMQGAGIGVMYLTVFAAFRLHPLLPSSLALVLLVVLTAALIALALLQNAVGLASAAVAGAFAAPILTSTGSGNHIALFSYFALLNSALMVIAWHKTWRVLNIIGFVGTFGIGFAWGLRSYTPAAFASTEPFLILFFLMYVGIGLLFTRRKLMAMDTTPAPDGLRALLHWSRKQTDYVDASLMFGPPLVGFGLQYAVVSHFEFGAAFSALALGLFYLGLALKLRQRLQARAQLLIDICLALGVIFGTLAIPLALDANWTAAVWAVEGAGLYWLGQRQQRPVARLFALLLQLGAAWNFVGSIESGKMSMLDADPLGSLLLGTALLFTHALLKSRASLLWAADSAAAHSSLDPAARGSLLHVAPWERRFLPVLAGLGLTFLYLLAPIFWLAQGTTMAWGLAGLVTLHFGLRLQSKTFLFCAFAVQLLGSVVFLTHMQTDGDSTGAAITGWGGLMGATSTQAQWLGLTPLLHGEFWAPAVLALAAFLGAWRLHLAYARATPDTDIVQNPEARSMDSAAAPRHWLAPRRLRTLSMWLLGGSALWWAFTVLAEVARFVQPEARTHVTLLVAAVSLAAWVWVARRAQWGVLAHASLSILPIGAITLLAEADSSYHPAAQWGWLAWTLAFALLFWLLKTLAPRLRLSWQRVAHVTGAWMVLAVLSLELHFCFAQLAEPGSAWRWLGWVLIPCAYLMWMTSARPWGWPVTAFEREYRVIAAIPVVILLLLWFWIANMESSGDAAPLPFIPLLNPLELAMLLTLFCVYEWMRKEVPSLLPRLPQPATILAVAGASLFMLVTASVFRTSHHWADIPYQLDAQLASMLVQASLSILWTSIALTLMIAGHRIGQRQLWLVGGALIAVVVAKLFFVELGNRGGLERIVSFMGVGVLLLIVGYFAPLPPRQKLPPEDNATREGA
ncbi:Hypothetical protein HDN1F_11470 [gamma proteobacterium HdN1]|nr:Hypothetical protein HDN1F_11470 [gamma proteobacterium HdN1]